MTTLPTDSVASEPFAETPASQPPLAPPPARRPWAPGSMAAVITIVLSCGIIGASFGGVALGVVAADNPPAPLPTPPVAPPVTEAPPAALLAVAPSTAPEANLEEAGDGVMDDLDDAPFPTSVAPSLPSPTHTSRHGGQMVTSDDVPDGPVTGYVEAHPVRIVVTKVDGKPVEVHTAVAYRVMFEAARRAGVVLHIVSGFRTMEHQQALYRAYRHGQGNLAAQPGTSNHQSGHALDLNTSTPGVMHWLQRNAQRYGFRRTVPTEAWHWEWW